MPTLEEKSPRSNFQGSENSGVEIIAYPQGEDPILVSTGTTPFRGRGNYRAQGNPNKRDSDSESSIIRVTVNKSMGATGSWSLTVRLGKDALNRRDFFLESLVDDDWIDITFTRHAGKNHVMRGLIKSIRRTRAATGNGATSLALVISGTCFQNIWEKTPIWFNPHSSAGSAASNNVFGGLQSIRGSPDTVVNGYLVGMLRELSAEGRGTWILPTNIPNGGGEAFRNIVNIDTSLYPTEFKNGGENSLVAFDPNWLTLSGDLWQLAASWADPIYNELYTDTLPENKIDPKEDLLPADTIPTVVFREKPFPTLDRGRNSAWFGLPKTVIPLEQIQSDDIGRGGDERFNAFFVAPKLSHEASKSNSLDIFKPLWSPNDIYYHGLRRFDVTSKYAAENVDVKPLLKIQRERIRDWYAINPYLYSGTMQLAVGRPDIRIGTRVEIPSAQGPSESEHYYVEGVSHTWSLGPGAKTSLTLTRGYHGDDDQYLDRLNAIAATYEIPEDF